MSKLNRIDIAASSLSLSKAPKIIKTENFAEENSDTLESKHVIDQKLIFDEEKTVSKLKNDSLEENLKEARRELKQLRPGFSIFFVRFNPCP